MFNYLIYKFFSLESNQVHGKSETGAEKVFISTKEEYLTCKNLSFWINSFHPIQCLTVGAYSIILIEANNRQRREMGKRSSQNMDLKHIVFINYRIQIYRSHKK